MENHVLVLDTFDPPDAGLSALLAQCGLSVQTAKDIAGATSWLREHSPACILARIREADAADLCRSLRTRSGAPIMAICTERDEDVIVRCLEAGADRVLLAPLSRVELGARIDALLSRRNGSAPAALPSQHYHVGDLVIDPDARVVTKAGLPVSLTPTEFRLLVALARRAGDVVTHAELLSQVWGPAYGERPENLRIYIRYLRQKLGDAEAQPRLLLCQRGVGYKLAQDTTSEDGKGKVNGQYEPGFHSGNARTRGPVRPRLALAARGS